MTFDPMDDQRRRDAEQRLRDAEQRERDRAQREREREKERADREREHEQRREERRARHEARHEFGFRHRGLDINVDVDPDEIARSVSAAFIGMDSDSDTETHDQTIEKTFTVDGMPRLRVQNVSGEIAIRVGESNQVRVVAHKRVKGGSADRAKRLLENVEVRIEQQGNDIFVEPHLYEQERSWLDLFRGKRLLVDVEITVPRETAVNAQTVSGDVEVGLLSSSCYCDYHTASGDLECDEPARIIREGRKDRTIIIGDGRSHLSVKTVSGDLTIKAASSSVREEPAAAEDSPEAEAEAGSEKESGRDPERTAPMAPPTTAKVHDLLERLARGEVSVDEVAAKLDESRRGQ